MEEPGRDRAEVESVTRDQGRVEKKENREEKKRETEVSCG